MDKYEATLFVCFIRISNINVVEYEKQNQNCQEYCRKMFIPLTLITGYVT